MEYTITSVSLKNFDWKIVKVWSAKFFILRSENSLEISRVLHEISKEHDAIIKGISSSSTLYLPDYGCPADVALGWKSMPLPMPLYRAASRMVLKCRVYTSLGRFHLIFLCLRFDFYCYRRCTKNPENRLPKDPRCCADAGSTRFDLCKRVDGQINHYEMKLSAIIEIIITFILITSKTILNQTKRRRKKTFILDSRKKNYPYGHMYI